MYHRFMPICVSVLVCALGILGNYVAAAQPPDVSSQLRDGKLSDAEQLLATHLESADDDLARFQLGVVQFLRAVEQLSQDAVRHGVLSNGVSLPFLRIGARVSDNTNAEPVTYDDVRAMLEHFQAGIREAEVTLANIDQTDLKWQVNFREVSLDLDGDGKIGEQENLDALFNLVGNRGRAPEGDSATIVAFDLGDVYWLRGYAHVLMGLADFVLAYDQAELFERTAQLVFKNPQTEFTRRRQAPPADTRNMPWNSEMVYDAIAMVHLIDFKLLEPTRMTDAHNHLLAMVDLSGQSWQAIQQETDNDREWIPGENQQSVIQGLQMDKERIASWHTFLKEAESVLEGERLIPFWRAGFSGGINLGRVFNEPRDFDLVLWVQGTDALPYLEDGQLTSPETWIEFQRVFRGEFVGFAIWIN